MAIYKAEDVAVKIDGSTVLATDLSFQTSAALTEDRRMGKKLGGQDFVESGPQTSTLSFGFYINQYYTSNPVFNLLRGLDLIFEDDAGDPLANDVGQMAVSLDTNGKPIWRGVGDWHTATMKYEGAIPAWAYSDSNGFTSESDNDTTWPWDGGFDQDSYYAYRTGFMGCITGSDITLGGTVFLSGAAMTSLEFTITPFAPVLCRATFEVYNPVTGTFTTGTGAAAANQGQTDIGHGMYSSYTGITGITDVESITWRVTAQRQPRYVVGSKYVRDIKTTRASKEITFNGWGPSASLLQDPPTNMTIKIGCFDTANLYTDTVSGKVIDESFELQGVGLMKKSFRIIQNMV